jgi:hypothetical protein
VGAAYTRASIWVSAGVGMACAAGMPVVATAVTALHLVTILLLAPLGRTLPTPDRRRVLAVRYHDGEGVLRTVLATATATSSRGPRIIPITNGASGTPYSVRSQPLTGPADLWCPGHPKAERQGGGWLDKLLRR